MRFSAYIFFGLALFKCYLWLVWFKSFLRELRKKCLLNLKEIENPHKKRELNNIQKMGMGREYLAFLLCNSTEWKVAASAIKNQELAIGHISCLRTLKST